jgi:hypothetical protein
MSYFFSAAFAARNTRPSRPSLHPIQQRFQITELIRDIKGTSEYSWDNSFIPGNKREVVKTLFTTNHPLASVKSFV